MTSLQKLLAFSFSLCLLYSAPLLAQDDEDAETTADNGFVIDEIVVTARKREENLQDIPVSISVLGADTLAEQNVLRQSDLADLIPGYYYNEGGGEDDRIAALPSIRGVGASEIATNRTKVSSFVDGIPIIGNIGAINIGGATQVEVFNGPQSAAFGRSTFAGAINYVTQDPGDEIEGSVGLNWSDQGTRIVNGNVGGPLIEGILGFQLGASIEDSVAPDDFYTFSDGTEGGTQTGDNYSVRFVFTPTDSFSAKLTFAHDDTFDGPNAEFYATQASALNCYDDLNTFESLPAMGMDNNINVIGSFDCELERDTSAGLQVVNDIGAYYRDPENADRLYENLTDPGDLATAEALAAEAGLTLEEALLLVADAYSVPSNIGSSSERDRFIFQSDYLFENESLLQFSYMESEEEYIRDYISEDLADPYIPAISMDGFIELQPDVGRADFSMADPTVIDETYAELRWASPADERIRYVVGASYYQYDFVTEVYFGGYYNAVRLGIEDQFETLTGLTVAPGATLSETTENTAAFFNVSYDFTDKITGSIEGRYSSDDVGALVVDYSGDDPVTQSASDTTKSFVPRLALNYNLNEDTTLYAQYAIGINPAGLNSDFVNPAVIASLDDGYELVVSDDGTQTIDYDPQDYYTFDSSDYATFDEEKLTNYEFGFKGTGLDGRLSYAGAIYFMEWEDATQSLIIDWEYPYILDDADVANGFALGDIVEGTTDVYAENPDDDLVTDSRITANTGTSETMGIELQGSYRINDNWSVSGNTSIMQAEYTDYCDFDNYTGNVSTDPDVYADIGDYAGLEVGETEGGDPCYVLDGLDLLNQPAVTASLSPTYRTEFGNGIGFSANTRFQYTGSRYTDYANVAKTPSTFRVNLTFGLTWESFSGTFYIENLLDDTSVTSASLVDPDDYLVTYPDNTVDTSLTFDSPSGGQTFSSYRYQIPTGRNFGLRMSYRF